MFPTFHVSVALLFLTIFMVSLKLGYPLSPKRDVQLALEPITRRWWDENEITWIDLVASWSLEIPPSYYGIVFFPSVPTSSNKIRRIFLEQGSEIMLPIDVHRQLAGA